MYTKSDQVHKVQKTRKLKNIGKRIILQKLQNFYENDSAFYKIDTNEYIPA